MTAGPRAAVADAGDVCDPIPAAVPCPAPWVVTA